MKDKNATVIVDLTPSEKEIMEGLHKDARWGIKRAQREGVIVRETKNDDDWNKFYEIYGRTMEEGGTTPLSLEELKNNSETFFVCEKDGTIIAGAGIWFADKYNSEIPRLYFNASLYEFQKMQPNNLLYWACILWSKRKEYSQFDLGGYQINAQDHLVGINKFKEKWGEIVYFEKDYSVVKALGRKVIRNSKFAKNTWEKIKAKKSDT